MAKQVYRKQLFGQKHYGERGQEWRKLVLKVGCYLVSLRHLLKQDLQAKSL
jgi:hypothetical protein